MKKWTTFFVIPFLFTGIYTLGFSVEKNRPGLTLKETFDIYVQAVQSSDLEALFTTVTGNPDLFFLTSRGKLIDSREGYYQFHKDWFEETGWEMPVEFLEAREGKEYGYTLAVFHYKEKRPDGGWNILDSYFTLIFHKEEGMWKVVADVCTPISRYTTESDTEIKYSSEQNYLFDIIKSRRTVRKFKSTPVPKEHILKILEAAQYAPTAGNQQPWKFMVIQNRDKLDRLQKAAFSWYLKKYKEKENPSPQKQFQMKKRIENLLQNVLSAPVYVAVLVDSEAPHSQYVLYDGTLAAGSMMVAARALGYGTGFFTSFFPEEKMKEFFQIPEQYRLICFSPIGVPVEWPETPPKKDIQDLVVFESFKKSSERKIK